VSEHFTPLTLDIQTEVVSIEDTDEKWEFSKKESIEKVRGNKNRTTTTDSPISPSDSVDQMVG